MVRRLMTVALVGCCFGLGACNMVRGAAADLNSAANCTEEAMRTGRC